MAYHVYAVAAPGRHKELIEFTRRTRRREMTLHKRRQQRQGVTGGLDRYCRLLRFLVSYRPLATRPRSQNKHAIRHAYKAAGQLFRFTINRTRSASRKKRCR